MSSQNGIGLIGKSGKSYNIKRYRLAALGANLSIVWLR